MGGWLVEKDETGRGTTCRWTDETRGVGAPVQVRIAASAINYKDALAVTGTGRIVRRFPCVPGIDCAGTVIRSDDPAWQPGDAVFATGWGMGEERDGGLAEEVGLDADMLQPLPVGWSPQQIMRLGTAGLTAMQGVIALERNGVTPAAGPVVVTGATGGVAMIAIHLLARLGYRVEAVTGKVDDPDARAQLEALGASELVDRQAFAPADDGPLATERYAGGIDTTGSALLAALVRRTRRYGAVATCGVAAGSDLPLTMFPFILRGVSLLGISSVRYPQAERATAWQRLTELCDPEDFGAWTTSIPLPAVPDRAAAMIAGQTRGRCVVLPDASE